MGFPIVTPAILNTLKEQLFPLNPENFCDIAVTVSAVEYVPSLYVLNSKAKALFIATIAS